jgi:hypothetical protein
MSLFIIVLEIFVTIFLMIVTFFGLIWLYVNRYYVLKTIRGIQSCDECKKDFNPNNHCTFFAGYPSNTDRGPNSQLFCSKECLLKWAKRQ